MPTMTSDDFCGAFAQLTQLLAKLPGFGPRSSERIVLELLDKKRDLAQEITQSLQHALDTIGHCTQCRMLCFPPVCTFCSDASRENRSLCITENTMNVLTIESLNLFKGRYFVLGSNLSPIDGIGPEQIGIQQLIQRLEQEQFEEVIIATGATAEGEATAHYITSLVEPYGIRCSVPANGVPMGSDLTYLDHLTLTKAFKARTTISDPD